MRSFKVRCFEAGVWDGVEPRDVEARDEQEAAERACGGPLIERGKPGHFRAEVWPASKPDQKKGFFEQPQPTKR